MNRRQDKSIAGQGSDHAETRRRKSSRSGLKTSTKIFIGVIAAAVALCIFNAVAASKQYKIYDAEAQRLARQLGTTPIRVVDITLMSPENPLSWRIDQKDRYSRRDGGRRLNISTQALESVRISADTLYIDRAEREQSGYWEIFRSPELEMVVFHTEGEPDYALDYRQPEPAPDSVALSPAPEGH